MDDDDESSSFRHGDEATATHRLSKQRDQA
jgi:hypothetical protein